MTEGCFGREQRRICAPEDSVMIQDQASISEDARAIPKTEKPQEKMSSHLSNNFRIACSSIGVSNLLCKAKSAT